jgi:hypothetical protein
MKKLPILLVALLSALTLRAEDPATFDVAGLTFTRPADWKWVETTSPMRKAQLKVPGAQPEQAADIIFFHFGAGAGGDVKANADRWLGQFKSAEGASKVEPMDVRGTKVTLVSTQGTFNSGMPGGPTTPLENQALLGAIIEGAQGNVFVKMTGPAELVKGSRERFLTFITTAIPKK